MPNKRFWTMAIGLLSACCLLACGSKGQLPVHKEQTPAQFVVRGESLEGELRFLPCVPRLGEFFRLDGEWNLKGAARQGVEFLEIDARMPSHSHGMLTSPVTQLEADGRSQTSGMKLHMFGDWEITIRLRDAAGATELLTYPFRFQPGDVRQ